MKKFFTADLHFGHGGIIEICTRPFNHMRHMEKSLIRNWNSVVSEDDMIYVIGDFSMKTKLHRGFYENIMNKLNGKKILICGNHEIDSTLFYAGDNGVGFQQVVYPYLEVEEFILIHDPVSSIVFPNRPWITGHVHQMWHTMRNCFNCGVDVNDYTPVSIETIRDYFKKQKEIKI